MKAVINNGVTYKVVSEKGAFTVTEDSKGKIKMFQTSTIEVVEIESMPKAKMNYEAEFWEREAPNSSIKRVLRNLIVNIEHFGKQLAHFLPKTNPIMDKTLDEDKLRCLAVIIDIIYQTELEQLEAMEDELLKLKTEKSI